MSRRRKIDRPADVAKAQAATYEALREQAEAARDAAIARPEAQAAIEMSRSVAESRAAYDEGSVPMGRKSLKVPTVKERHDCLWCYAPLRDALSWIRVRPQVVEVVMRVPYGSARTDGAMMGRTYALAMWLDETQGSFDWRRDLTQENIDAFAAANFPMHAKGTVNTYRSTLARVMRGGQVHTPRGSKTQARRAYSDIEFDVLIRTAEVAGDAAEDLLVHLALSGGAGLRQDEIPYAHASWVHESTSGLFIRVPNKRGEFRDVPLFGRYAATIRDAAERNAGTYLFCPTLKGRANAFSHLKRRVREMHPSIVDYDALRARHYWICRMLGAAVPTTLIAEIAGVHAGASLLADLLSEMPRPDRDESFAALVAAGLSD